VATKHAVPFFLETRLRLPKERVNESTMCPRGFASEVRRAVITVLGNCGLATIVASAAEEARAVLGHRSVSLIFCSDELPGEIVEDFVRHVTLPPQRIPVVVVLHVGEWERCLHFLNVGALDCVAYPLSAIEVQRITDNVLGLFRPEKAQQKVRQQSANAA